MSLKAKVEAVLFMTDKPLKAAVIAGIVNQEVSIVRQAILELIHDYETREGALEVADDDGYIFQIKDEYTSLMDEFLPIEMSNALLRTLSAIAIKQPISQSEIIRIRGAGAYDHIKDLSLRDLIHKKDDGRSPMLTTTKKFQDYFRLSKDGKSLRQHLRRQAKKQEEDLLEQAKQSEETLDFTPEPESLPVPPSINSAHEDSPSNTSNFSNAEASHEDSETLHFLPPANTPISTT